MRAKFVRENIEIGDKKKKLQDGDEFEIIEKDNLEGKDLFLRNTKTGKTEKEWSNFWKDPRKYIGQKRSKLKKETSLVFIDEEDFIRHENPFKALKIGKKKLIKINFYMESNMVEDIEKYMTIEKATEIAKKKLIKQKEFHQKLDWSKNYSHWASFSYNKTNDQFGWQEDFDRRISLIINNKFLNPIKKLQK